MGQAQGWTEGPAPDTSAWTPGAAPTTDTPHFSTVNEKDAQGNAVVRGLSSAWDTLNTPLVPQIADAAHAIAAHIDAPALDRSKTEAQIRGFFAGATEGAGNVAAGFTSPVGLALTLAGLGEDSAIVKQIPALKSLFALPAVKTLQRAVQTTGGAMFAAHGASRVVTDPTLSGKAAGAMEVATGALGATSALRTGTVPGGVQPSPLSPAEQASNQFAATEGIPLDAATATGSRFVRGVQKVSGESLLGSPTAERAQQAQQQALTRVGGALADETHPTPATPESAGAGVRDALTRQIQQHATTADTAYDQWRQLAGTRSINLTGVKARLQPLYDELMRRYPVARQQASAGLKALENIVHGPDIGSLAEADANLSAIKEIARGADLPELRTTSQGTAAAAVKELDGLVRAETARAGQPAVTALNAGRTATIAKYQVADVLDSLSSEPVQAYRKLAAPKDTNIDLLRQVAQAAPAEVPTIGRGYLESLLDQATERDRFDHADKMYAEWQKLGPETKRTLFPDADLRARLDNFFLLAKRIAENPNASGTAPTMIKTAEVVTPMAALFSGNLPGVAGSAGGSLTMGALAKILYTPAGVRAVTRLLASTATSPSTLRTAAQTAGWAELAAAAQTAGVPLGVPQAADATSERDRTR